MTLRPLDGAAVMVNGDPIGGEYRLQNGDTIKIGRSIDDLQAVAVVVM